MRVGFFQRNAARLVALALLLTLYGFARLPRLPEPERARLAARFAFARLPLPEPGGSSERSLRAVHPDLARISAWISSVGAAVALNDLDGDGLSNDVCSVDTRTDRLVAGPAPGTGARFAAFALAPSPLPYDAATMAPMGCLPGDLNEDGRMDVLAYYWGRPPVAFLRRAGTPVPAPGAYEPVEVAPTDERGGRWFTNAATLADVDGDGHVDVVIGNYFPDDARVLDVAGGGEEQMQASMSRADNGGVNRILLWQAGTPGEHPGVRFAEARGAFSDAVARAWTLALGAADLDGDLLPELYFANDFGPDRLLHNRSRPGHPRFAVVEGKRTWGVPSSKVLGHDSFKGMGVDFGDLNGDRLLDIYVSDIAADFALEESHLVFVSTGDPGALRRGVAPYVDESEALGLSRSNWGWDSRLADFDNDGVLEAMQATGFVRGEVNRWPELHELAMGNDGLLRSPGHWPVFQAGDDLSGNSHPYFFVRSASGRYFDLSHELGLDDRQVSRGIATADVDGDGDLDFAVANQWQDSYLFRNDSPGAGASLVLALALPPRGQPGGPGVRELAGPAAAAPLHRPALGAAAAVHLPDGRVLVGQVDGGNGHSGKRSPELHFGLGRLPAGTLVPVELSWRGAGGAVHRRVLRLPAGRHTVLLGDPERKES